MPRLNHNNYVARHQFLKQAWQECPNLFSAVSVRQQRDIHAYFQPSKDLTNSELRQHRRGVTKRDSSLPQRAGNAFAVMDDVYRRALVLRDQGRVREVKSKNPRSVRVRPIVHPEPDYHRLARAFIELAKVENGDGASEETLAA